MTERTRFLVAAVLGVSVAAATGFVAPWPLTVLIGWLVTALTFVAWTAMSVGRLDPEATRALASKEDNSPASTRLLLVLASVVSLPGTALALHAANDAESPLSVVLTATAVATVAVSWVLVHTVFTLRYGALYFRGEPGGIDFPHEDAPNYWEFAYLAFTVGMTFQVSDTDITSRPMRQAVLRHALLSYLFGAVIVAITINVIGGLLH